MRYLKETKLLNYKDETIQTLITTKKWKELDTFHQIQAVYNFVRNEILFGYNAKDETSASMVLQDGIGQCNTKGILLMALLRTLGIPCRVHALTVDKKLQKGIMSKLVYALAPRNVFHSWVEVEYESKWYALEGVILDQMYLKGLQLKFKNIKGSFCGYGVAVEDFQNPTVEWNINDTFIQKESVNQDFDIYDDPDSMMVEHQQSISKFKELMYRKIGRHWMNHKVKRIRKRNK